MSEPRARGEEGIGPLLVEATFEQIFEELSRRANGLLLSAQLIDGAETPGMVVVWHGGPAVALGLLAVAKASLDQTIAELLRE